MDCMVQGSQRVGHDWVTFSGPSLHRMRGYGCRGAPGKALVQRAPSQVGRQAVRGGRSTHLHRGAGESSPLKPRVVNTQQKEKKWTSLAVQWLRLCLLMQGLWVQTLVRELRSYMPCGQKNHRSKIVTNSIKTFKMVYMKKSLKRKIYFFLKSPC